MQTICKVAKPKEHDEVIFSKERINCEQSKRVIINLCPTFVMDTRHGVIHLHNAYLCSTLAGYEQLWTVPQTHNFPDDWFSNLGEYNTGLTEHLCLKDGSVPVYLDLLAPLNLKLYVWLIIDVYIFYRVIKIWNYNNGRVISNMHCMR